MAFQKTVAFAFANGMVGESANDAPRVSRMYRLDETAGKVHTVGFAYTFLKEANGVQVATPGGDHTKAFAGVLAVPKHYALNGTATDGPLAPSLNLLGGSEGELVTEGNIYVAIDGAVAYGAPVKYKSATGEFATAGDTVLPGAYYAGSTTKAGVVLIQLNGDVVTTAVTP